MAKLGKMKAYIVVNTENGMIMSGASGKTVFTTKTAAKLSWNANHGRPSWKRSDRVQFNDQDVWKVKEFILDLTLGEIV